MAKSLRSVVDLSTIAAGIALVAMLAWHFSGEFRRDGQLQSVRNGLRQFEQVLSMRAAAKDSPLTRRGWPTTMEPSWFGGGPPLNALLTPNRPWVEIAPPEESHLRDPNIRVAVDNQTAGFWYNPYLGILRARVPYDISDERAREMYNQVNGTSVSSIYGTELPQFGDVPYGPPAELAGTPGGTSTDLIPNE